MVVYDREGERCVIYSNIRTFFEILRWLANKLAGLGGPSALSERGNAGISSLGSNDGPSGSRPVAGLAPQPGLFQVQFKFLIAEQVFGILVFMSHPGKRFAPGID
jgi:hypothetical protein